MRAFVVVIVRPSPDRRFGVIEPEEQRFVEQFVAHATVEALAKAVLHGLARRDVMPLDLVFVRPR